MINTIIFDIGNVLAQFAWEDYLIERDYDTDVIEKIANATVYHKLWKELDRSVDFGSELVEQFASHDPGISDEITDFLEHSHLVVKEYEYSIDLIQRLKANGYKVYLLSNYGGRNFKYARENFAFLKHADGSLISYEVGFVKPEREIYDAIISKYHIIPEEAVFLDDSELNIIAAASIGFHTIHFKNLEMALTEMRKLDIKI